MPKYEGNIIVIEHPLYVDRHIVVRVIRETPATLTIISWDLHGQKWHKDAVRRKKQGILGILGTKDMNPALIQQTSKRLYDMSQELFDTVRQARKDYVTRIKEII